MTKFSIHDRRLENTRAVFREILAGGQISKREIAAATGLSLVTVGKIISVLYRGALITKAPPRGGKVGRPAECFQLRTDALLPIFDLSERTFRFALYTAAGELIDEVSQPFSPDITLTATAFNAFLRRAHDFLRARGKRLRILGVGVVIPGVYLREDDRILSTMIPELAAIEPLQSVKRIFTTGNIVIENAARLSAESVFETADESGDKTLCCLAVNDGIECAVAAHGRFFTGSGGLAGRLGDLPFAGMGRIADYIRGAAETEEIEDALLFVLQTAVLAYDPDVLFLLSSRFYFDDPFIERLSARLRASLSQAVKAPTLRVCGTDLAERRQALCRRVADAYLLSHLNQLV